MAYSGGLDTSIIIPWLIEKYRCEVIALCVDIGSIDNPERLQHRARASGASALCIVDAREEFAEHYLLPLVRSGALYESTYLLGTAIARPLQAFHQVRCALSEGADALVHGCTGKGNDQVRFETAYRVLAPQLRVIAPWREWDIGSRSEAIAYAERHNIPLDGISRENIYSRDSNIWHTSHEGGEIESVGERPPEEIYQRTTSPSAAPDQECEVSIEWEQGVPVAVNGIRNTPAALIVALNELGGRHGIGRADVIESRITGMKSRGLYETPGGTILYRALQDLEALTMNRELRAAKRALADRYAELVYTGRWFTHLREAIEAFMAHAARVLSGTVRLVLYKATIISAGRTSPYTLYDQELSSFDTDYDHHDAGGFIKLYALQPDVIVQQEYTSQSLANDSPTGANPSGSEQRYSQKLYRF